MDKIYFIGFLAIKYLNTEETAEKSEEHGENPCSCFIFLFFFFLRVEKLDCNFPFSMSYLL
jgi:hypothetical protein